MADFGAVALLRKDDDLHIMPLIGPDAGGYLIKQINARGDPAMRAALPDWEENARFAIGVFRLDVARAGDSPEAEAIAAELQATSADFRRLWADNEMRSHQPALKRLLHPLVGPLALEASAFAVEGANGLTMIVFTPAAPADARAIARLLSDT